MTYKDCTVCAAANHLWCHHFGCRLADVPTHKIPCDHWVAPRNAPPVESEYIRMRMGERDDTPTTEWHKIGQHPPIGLAVVADWDSKDATIYPELVYLGPDNLWYVNKTGMCIRTPDRWARIHWQDDDE